ncbi:type IV pilus assembly protein PilM [Demequina sp.]|uniref:type IV pilus assembly protein PilM n=1 Tax=Demequina sp. TaxID=2050685 RepID=UPI003A88C9B1
MATKTVAIDVGATAIRVAEVELKGGGDPRVGAVLHAYAERPMPAGVMRDGSIEEPGAFAQVVKEVVSAAKPSGKKVVIAVGHPSVIVREVDVPSQDMEKVRQSLAFHVQDSLPMAVDEALLDFHPTSEVETPQGPFLRGLLVASPKELVRGLLTGLNTTGVQPIAVDHSAFALWRAGCRGELVGANIALVDVGAVTTTIAVSQSGATRLVRVLPQGGQDATKAIANAYKGSSVDAEAVKRHVGMNAAAANPEHRAAAEAVSHAMGPLIESIRNTLVYYAGNNPGAAVERIVLTGGGAYLSGFGQALSSATRLAVMIGDPFAGLAMSKGVNPDGFRGREAELATVVGMAMVGVR